MAQIPLVSGGSQPVFATDTLNGPQLAANVAYAPVGTPVNFQGPKLDFFGIATIDTGATAVNPFNQCGVNGAVQQMLQAIQSNAPATVAMYQVQNTTNAVNFSVAVYPTGAYTATSLQAVIQGLGNIQVTNNGVTTGFDVGGSLVTNVGFRLASTATSAS